MNVKVITYLKFEQFKKLKRKERNNKKGDNI